MARGIAFYFAVPLAVASCDRAPSSAVAGSASASLTAPVAAKASAAPPALPAPGHAPPRASSGSTCGKTPTAGPACEDGLECFEKQIDGDIGICAERFEVEPLLEDAKRLQGRWIGLRDRKVATASYNCASIRCSTHDRCIPCSALLVLEDPYGKLFLLKNGSQLKCTARKGNSLPLDTPRCDMQRGTYAVVVGRLVDAGFRWAKLDLAVTVRLPTRR